MTSQPASKISEILENKEKGCDWLVAALVHGSIGYYTPLGADNLIKDYICGKKKNYSERCATCFQCNLEKEITHDVSTFEKLNSSSQKKLMLVISEVRKMDGVSQTTFGLYYPTKIL